MATSVFISVGAWSNWCNKCLRFAALKLYTHGPRLMQPSLARDTLVNAMWVDVLIHSRAQTSRLQLFHQTCIFNYLFVSNLQACIMNLRCSHACICKSMMKILTLSGSQTRIAWFRNCYSAAILERTLTLKITSKRKLLFKGCRNLPMKIYMYSNANYVRSITVSKWN